MKLLISNSSPTPIYLQIKEAIINQIISKELQESELLPSIRSLAKDIRISVMTIKKAYDELEKEGYIVTVAGKGSFVATTNLELVKEQAYKDIEVNFNNVISIIKRFNLDKEEVKELFNYLLENDDE